MAGLGDEETMTATFYVGDAIDVMSKLPERSVDLILTSPPFLALRSYLPADHESKALEGGSQATPGEYVDWLIDVVEACSRVLAPHGSLCFELGDTYSGSTADGGDNRGNDRYPNGRSDMGGSRAFIRPDKSAWPLAKSLSLIPESFRWAMVYGHNPHTGRTTEPWRLRNVIRWVRPNPPVGALGDKFRPATSELMVFCKAKDRYFDLDAVREPSPYAGMKASTINGMRTDQTGESAKQSHGERIRYEAPATAPPLDWWNIPLLEGEEPTRYGPKDQSTKNWEHKERYGKPGGAYSRKAEDHEDRQSMLGPGRGSALFPNRSDGLGAPPLDWWNIPPGGYPGAHYAVWPPELLIKPIKAMSPEQVCRVCGEPRRRIVATQPELDGQRSLANEIATRRTEAGVSRADMVAWFPHYKNGESVMAQVSNWELAKNVPSPGDWEILKERLGVAATFDGLVNGDRTWTESLAEYVPESGPGKGTAGLPPKVNPAGRGFEWHEARRISPNGFSDCSHDDFRPGLVLDPFAGSGTTLSVATGHGRDAIGIDLDARNFDLALDRVGPLILERGTL